MNSVQNFVMVSAVILFFGSISADAKPTDVINFDGGNFGPIESQRNHEEEVEIQSYGGSGQLANPIVSQQQLGSGARPDLFQMRQLIRVILDEIRNRRVQLESEAGKSQALLPRQLFGKRQIVYRQCFFNPISCF